MSEDTAVRSRFWSAGLILLAVDLGGFGLIRMNCDFMINGIGADFRYLPKPLHNSSSNWDRPFVRLVVEAYRPLFWADQKLTSRWYFDPAPSPSLVVPWP